jgi:tRNA(Ile)-lysidine synthase
MFTAHTARDQAETLLMRVVRGTGPAGLAAIAARRGRFVRPLLGVARADTERYVTTRALPTWDDPMNRDPAFTRVRVRAAILPALRRENPNLDDALLRLARAATEWRDAIDELARPHGAFPIDAPELAALPAAIRKRALAMAIERAGAGYDAVHLDALDALVVAPVRGERGVDLPSGRIVRTYDRVDLATAPAVAPPIPAPPGHELRVWRPGDRMRPARLRGRARKLSDLFTDAKVPASVRRTARVLVRSSDGVIVWAEHLGTAYSDGSF